VSDKLSRQARREVHPVQQAFMDGLANLRPGQQTAGSDPLEVTMQTILRRPLAAAVLLSCAAALLAQPALAGDAHPDRQAPAAAAATARDHEHEDHDLHDEDRHDHDRHDHDRVDHDRAGHVSPRDERAPTIADLSPLPGQRIGEQLRMTVSARFRDDASGVDPASVRLRIDGRDVTGASRVAGDEVRFFNNLFPGRHVAEVTVSDRAGNIARRSWQFNVVDRGGERYGHGDEHRDRQR
jgi:hypothetical protein